MSDFVRNFLIVPAAGLAAVLSLASLAPRNLSSEENNASPDVPTPDGFVQIEKNDALKLAAALPKCIIKERVSDSRLRFERGPLQKGQALQSGEKRIFSSEITPTEAMAMRPDAGGINWQYSVPSSCQKVGEQVLSDHGKGALPSFVMAPNEDGTRLKVVVLAAGGKYFTPKAAPF